MRCAVQKVFQATHTLAPRASASPGGLAESMDTPSISASPAKATSSEIVLASPGGSRNTTACSTAIKGGKVKNKIAASPMGRNSTDATCP